VKAPGALGAAAPSPARLPGACGMFLRDRGTDRAPPAWAPPRMEGPSGGPTAFGLPPSPGPSGGGAPAGNTPRAPTGRCAAPWLLGAPPGPGAAVARRPGAGAELTGPPCVTARRAPGLRSRTRDLSSGRRPTGRHSPPTGGGGSCGSAPPGQGSREVNVCCWNGPAGEPRTRSECLRATWSLGPPRRTGPSSPTGPRGPVLEVTEGPHRALRP